MLSVILLAGLAFFGYRMYMEHRTTLFNLPNSQRVLLYGAWRSSTFALVATSRMWDSGGLVLLWFALIGTPSTACATVLRAYHEY